MLYWSCRLCEAGRASGARDRALASGVLFGMTDSQIDR